MSITASSTTVVNRRSGEILDVHQATEEDLARFHHDADEVKAEIADAQAIVNAELVARLDRDRSWTLRVGDPTGALQFEIKAPSPDAGTETYPPVDLERELRALLDRGVISERAAANALTRQLALLIDVPFGADLDDLVAAVKASTETELAGIQVTVAKADAVRKSVMAGIKALRKGDGANAALDRVKVTLPTGLRKAKVTVKTRDQS